MLEMFLGRWAGAGPWRDFRPWEGVSCVFYKPRVMMEVFRWDKLIYPHTSHLSFKEVPLARRGEWVRRVRTEEGSIPESGLRREQWRWPKLIGHKTR